MRTRERTQIVTTHRPRTDDAQEEFEREVHRGLSAQPKRLPSRFFYDDAGSELFARISELPEYYLTRCEQEILTLHAGDLAKLMPDQPFLLVELGAGDGRKTDVIIEAFERHDHELTYIPIDISAEALRSIEQTLRDRVVPVRGIHAEYQAGLTAVATRPEPKCLLFLGSNIGNMNPEEAGAFIGLLSRGLRRGDLCIIGFDLQKEVGRLHAAYNDAAGVTTEFNMNLLDRMNREAGADFDRNAFEHYGFYNPSIGAMESWIISRRAQTVTVGEHRYDFRPGEGILVEYSYKYTIGQIESFASIGGFSVVHHLTDDEETFVDSVWRKL